MTASAKKIDQLTELVDQNRLVKSLADMVAIPSVNPFDDPAGKHTREQEFAEAYLLQMQNNGMQTQIREVVPGRPNVFGHRPGKGGGPTVMLAGHLDTVGVDGYNDPFNPEIKNGRVYGRGSCDMKAALAAYIEVARIINQADLNLRGDLIIAGVADEEHSMLGSKEVSEHGPTADFAIIGEPTELQVCHAHKGQLCMPIKTFGKACHSSVPEQGVNAITQMGQVLGRLQTYADQLQQAAPHPVCGHGRVNPGVIKGGSITSTVPDYCELEIDRRTLSGETAEQIAREYTELLTPLAHADPDFRFEIGAATLDNPPLDTPPDSAVVTTVAAEVKAITGSPAQVGAFPAATDAPNFRCEAVVCGPGSLLQAHTLDEYVEIPQLLHAAKIYLRSVLQLIA